MTKSPESPAALVLTTVANSTQAAALSRFLVGAHHAACVSVVEDLRSPYRWEGKVVEERECLLLIKAPSDAVPALREALLAQHPYEVPEVLVLEARGVPEPYAAWLRASTE
jgi:periplasmic divalent cation tolerance protein